MRPLTPEGLRANPELATLASLTTQLELAEIVLASVHGGAETHGALADQARSMARVSRILSDQLRAYTAMVEVDVHEQVRRFR